MSARPPEARQVVEESSIVVHRTHDLDEPWSLATRFAFGSPEWFMSDPGDLPDWMRDATRGEQVWLRTVPAPHNDDLAYCYRQAQEGERGAFRAVIFSGEHGRCRWWRT